MRKSCFFCQKETQPSYKEGEVLERFLSDRGQILGRKRTGLCQKHQKRLGKAVKAARHLGLLPFVVKA